MTSKQNKIEQQRMLQSLSEFKTLAGGDVTIKGKLWDHGIGSVFEGVYRFLNVSSPVAIKISTPIDRNTGEINCSLYIEGTRELHILQYLAKIPHQNIIRYVDSYVTAEYCALIIRRADISLYDIAQNGWKAVFDEVSICTQIINGLKFLHENFILHLDIRLPNILLTSDNVVKICDFGKSHIIKNGAHKEYPDNLVVPGFIPPECNPNKMEIITEKFDSWLLGFVIASVSTRDNWNFKANFIHTLPDYLTFMSDLRQKFIDLEFNIGAYDNSLYMTILSLLERNPKYRRSIKDINCNILFLK